ncbi:hypothetical protein THAOC_08854 [Thalassiosira oceanica]|uniref:Uncharacterized protein n=1 Tax=Thalassiosira oceanica TaxID=159749 RepID=K0SY00_THAOC|nr:hypothetical protein THAOC_08854 [Thalassiosira oceanica]|eukprot:EJK69849.1 hypothetical protein THAOC_08854 [Thalassiosira oceanica]
MKSSIAVLASAISAAAFSPASTSCRRTSSLSIGKDVDLSGNSWKRDYFPEGYDPREEIAFTEGMGGSQAGSDKDRGPALPGMENLGEDAVMMGGIEEASEIPSDMEFVMSSVPDGEIKMDVASSSSKGAELLLTVKPVCRQPRELQRESCRWKNGSKGGEPTELTVTCKPAGQSGELVGNLVINLPEDNSKICYKIIATAF